MQGASTDPASMQGAADSAELIAAADSVEASKAEKAAEEAAEGQMFIINLISFESEVGAAAEQGRLAREDIQSRIKQVSVNGRTWYRLISSESFNKTDARARLKVIKAHPGLASAWLEPVHPE